MVTSQVIERKKENNKKFHNKLFFFVIERTKAFYDENHARQGIKILHISN